MSEFSTFETSEKVSLKRPWQGTTLGVFSMIGAVGSFLFAGTVFISLAAIFSKATAANDISDLMVLFVVLQAIFSTIVGILEIFVARGFFKGQRWEIVLTSIFIILGALFSTFRVENFGNLILGFTFPVFSFYLLYICWKHPFYAKK